MAPIVGCWGARRKLLAVLHYPAMRGIPPRDGALGDLRVVDFTWARAGPQATRIFAMFGAQVIRVEWPENFDVIRIGSPRHTPPGMRQGWNTNADFNNFNCSKLAITLDVKRPEGLDLLKRIVAVSDVVIENFSAGVLERWGLGHERLRRVNPSLVYISMAGFGHTGRYRDYTSWGPAIQAMSGLTFLVGLPGRQPAGWGHSYMDHTAGYYAAIAVLAALRHRKQTGEGQYIDLAQMDVACTMPGAAMLDASVNGRSTAGEGMPPGNRTHWPGSPLWNTYRGRPAAPHSAYRCAGGRHNDWCAIACFTHREWQSLVAVMGNPSWASDHRFATLLRRLEQQDDLDKHIEAWTATLDKYEVTRQLQVAGVPAAPVEGPDDRVVRDPQLLHRHTFATHLRHPVIGDEPFEALPMRMSRTPWSIWRSGPLIGEDNYDVVRDIIGVNAAEYMHLERGGLFWPKNMPRPEQP